MLLTRDIAEGIRDGSVTAVFRRWDQPRARVGGTQRTTAGVIRFTSVDTVSEDELTDDDARGAGMPSLAALRKAGEKRAGMQLYRIGVTFDRPDERVSLRQTMPASDDLLAIDAALDKLDGGRKSGAWTRHILRMIADRPGTRAPDLAASLGRQTRPFKADVRRFKELGLTESLPVGYRLSDRGRAYLDWSATRRGR